MIEINLLPSQRKKKGAGLRLPDIGEVTRTVRDPLLVGAVGSWVLVLVAIGFVFVAQQARLAQLRAEFDSVESEARRFSALMAQKRRAERLRDSLQAELQSIRQIDADRYVWPHVMEEVTKALPDFTWLVGLEFVGGPPPAAAAAAGADTLGPLPVRFEIEGRTPDISAYTRFLRQLGDSPWITNVIPGATNTVVEEAKPITAFTIQAQFRPADSVYIRTVPVGESVR